MTTLLTIFFLGLIISVLVFVHELGHFLAAKISKVPVEEFAIGFGPKIFSKVYKGTKYSLNLLPLGGYVQLEGENESLSENSFRNKKFRYKAFVLLAGVTMNMILAVFLLAFFLNNNGYKFALPKFSNYTFTNTEYQGEYFPLNVTFVDPKGPSFNKLDAGEIIVGINNNFFKTYTEFQKILKDNVEKKVTLNLLNKENYTLYTKELMLPKQDATNGSILYVRLDDGQSTRPAYFIKYKDSFVSGLAMTYDLFIYQVKALGSLITNSVRTGNYEEVSKNVGSLPAIANQVDQAVTYKAYEFLIPLTAVFSINLAIINVIPFPALDGGQLAVAFIERIRRKKISDELLAKINTIGFSVLMGFGLLLIIKDIIQLNWLSGLVNGVKEVFGR